MSEKRIITISPKDLASGENAGRKHFETYQEDIDQIVAEEEATKDRKKDELGPQERELKYDVKLLQQHLNNLDKAWNKEETKLGESITEIDLKRKLTELRGQNLKIWLFLLVEVLFTATVMEFALGISRFEAVVAAIGYPALSSIILQIIFNNLKSKNALVLSIFVPCQIIILGVLAVFAYIRADATASGLPDVPISFLRFSFVGLVTVISLVLGYLIWKRQIIKVHFGPLIKIFTQRKKMDEGMNDLKTLLTNVRDQQDGLDEEFEKTKTLRVKSYQAGYRKGVMPFKHSLETKLTELERERQRHTDLLNGLNEEYKRTAEARQATYESGFEKGVAIRQRRKRFLTFLFPKRSKQSEVSS